MPSSQCIAILGAGSVGCYLGGCLAAAKLRLTLIGRPRIQQLLQQNGLTVSDWQGRASRIPYDDLHFACSPEALGEADIILVTVKGGDTEAAARDIRRNASPAALIVSFQNGLRNGELLQSQLPGHCVLKGMVPFNVVNAGQGRFHCGTEGQLALEARDGRERRVAEPLERAGLPALVYADMAPVQWGKLLMNLNNPINALAGMPLLEQLQTRGYRKVLAASIREALQVLKAAGIKPARTGKVVPSLLPFVLSLPDVLFRRIAGALLKIDPQARSSMAEDLELGRKTEITFLNGEIVNLAESVACPAPVNRRIMALVQQAESQGQGSPGLSPPQLITAVLSAASNGSVKDSLSRPQD